MQIKPVSLAVLALSAQAMAEVAFYRRALAPALARRDTDSPYKPDQELCGVGTTCQGACGAEYKECSSSDSKVHCYNPAQKEKCCSSKTGMSCEDQFFCAAGKDVDTVCCPAGEGLGKCATRYGVSNALTSIGYVTAEPSTTSSSAPSSSSAPPTTYSAKEATTTSSSSSSSTSSSTSSSKVHSSNTYTPPTTYALAGPSSSIISVSNSTGFSVPSNPTSTDAVVSSTPSVVSPNVASAAGPAGALVALAAVVFAALL